MRTPYIKRIGKGLGEEGLAYLEFALIAPVLLLLLLGGVEVSRYIQTSQKVDKLAHTIVDLVAQAPTISTQELNQIFAAAQHIMEPHDFDSNGSIIISCLGYNNQGSLVIKWQYPPQAQQSSPSRIGQQGSTPSLPSGFVVEARDNVIVSEAFFLFTPIINEKIVQNTQFYRTAYYLPRLGELSTLTIN